MKKALALVLVLTMALGMSTVAFAANRKIDTLDADLPILEFLDEDGGDFRAGDSILMQFVRDDDTGETNMNYADNGDPVKVSEITKNMLSDSKITVKKTASKGGDLLDTIEFAKIDNEVFVEIELVDEFVSVKEKDFDFKVNLYYGGKKVQDYTFGGTMTFETIDLYDGDDYVSLEDGEVAEAHDYLRAVEVYLGEGVSVTTNMFSGTSYYGTASQKVSSADLAVLDQYSEIETVYTLRTVNLSGGGNIVSFDLDDSYYVYNADGSYIGTTAEKLPYSSKYYLASSRITMTEEAEVTEEPADEADEGDDNLDAENPDMGGDGAAVGNVNDNPGTGVNGYLNVAMVAGLVALAAAGAVSMKK